MTRRYCNVHLLGSVDACRGVIVDFMTCIWRTRNAGVPKMMMMVIYSRFDDNSCASVQHSQFAASVRMLRKIVGNCAPMRRCDHMAAASRLA